MRVQLDEQLLHLPLSLVGVRQIPIDLPSRRIFGGAFDELAGQNLFHRPPDAARLLDVIIEQELVQRVRINRHVFGRHSPDGLHVTGEPDLAGFVQVEQRLFTDAIPRQKQPGRLASVVNRECEHARNTI